MARDKGTKRTLIPLGGPWAFVRVYLEDPAKQNDMYPLKLDSLSRARRWMRNWYSALPLIGPSGTMVGLVWHDPPTQASCLQVDIVSAVMCDQEVQSATLHVWQSSSSGSRTIQVAMHLTASPSSSFHGKQDVLA